ncbi:MAG: tetratricopeptide repeat protein [Proteobacteria bacterium]|nr:tetratricopeptide repeat protein [Pseudomonadota bacterium]
MNGKQRRQQPERRSRRVTAPTVTSAPDGGAAEAALATARRRHRAGRFREAEALYRRILETQPDHAEALHLLGVIALQTGRHKIAADLFAKAVARKPDFAEAHCNLGVAVVNQGKLGEAVASFRQAVSLKPDFADAHSNLGTVLKNLGKLEEAVAAYRKAIALRPDYTEAHFSLGVALKRLGRLDEAVVSYRTALALKPDFAEAHNNLGNALKQQNKFADAVTSYREAIALKPDFAEAHYNCGNALRALRRRDEAAVSYRKAIALKPDHAGAHSNLGNVLTQQGKLEEAVASHRKAIALMPDLAEALTKRGGAPKGQGRDEATIASQRKALELNSDFASFHSNLLLALNYADGISNEDIFAEHLEFDERHARPLAAHIQPHRNDPDPARRLKIGYVSPDFRRHSVAFFIEPVLERHDHEGCEIFCYYNHRRVDEVTERLRRYADHWIGCAGMTDEALADRIRKDRIDILVDLTGHTANNRLLVFARKPAPVQATWLGYPNTTGLAAMDYRITNADLNPMGETEQFFTEELVRLPIHAGFRPPPDSPDVGALPAVKAGYVTFASFNNFAKITPAVMALWARILKGVKSSRLIIMNVTPGEAESHVRQTFANNGIADGRLILMQRIRFAEFLELHNSVDIGLDTFPYNGGTTTRLGLWMGVPYITLAGAVQRSRVGARLLSHVGHPELIATTPKEYVRRAVDLATDIGRLRELRAGLRGRVARSFSTDGELLTRSLETAYRKMWTRYCNREHEQNCSIEIGEEHDVGHA